MWILALAPLTSTPLLSNAKIAQISAQNVYHLQIALSAQQTHSFISGNVTTCALKKLMEPTFLNLIGHACHATVIVWTAMLNSVLIVQMDI